MLFGFVIHPIQFLNTRSIGRHQIRNQRLDLGLCFRRKILRRKELAYAKAHCAECPEAVAHTEVTTTDRSNVPFPSRLLLLLTGERLPAQLKVAVVKAFDR